MTPVDNSRSQQENPQAAAHYWRRSAEENGMPQPAQRYLVEQAVSGGLVNLLLNGALAWLLYHDLTVVPLEGQRSINGDTVVTAFLLPVLIALIVMPIARGQLRAGRVTPLAWPSAGLPMLRLLPARPLGSGLLLAALSMLLVAMPLLWVLRALNVEGLRFWEFVAFKSLGAALLAGGVTPIVAARAIGEQRPGNRK